MPSPMPFSDFKRKLRHFGITLKPGGRGSHYKLTKVVGGVTIIYTVAVHHSEVDDVYVRGTRKRFRLTPAHGVSDEEFSGA